MKRTLALLLFGCALAAPSTADAFCGFYVSGAKGALYNNATQVVMMREGTRTVLSMQNNYQGPPEKFAMVVPVPVVLQEANVKTLPAKIFERVDQLAAPRLVEYWEQDPCGMRELADGIPRPSGVAAPQKSVAKPSDREDLGVTIEAQFTVGEYEIVILSAKDSTGLNTWLNQEGYSIPDGAEPHLRPYVEKGSKFFVAKVDPSKVRFENGMATLSPLRFHYDSDEFSLPIRLGMINAKDAQDLIVHVLARGKRYETANYKNVFIPTNIDVKDATRERFGEFYAALFDATLEKNPGAVVTEYSWDAGTCDPCPTPALNFSELATLGADVIDQRASAPQKPSAPPTSGAPAPPLGRRMPPPPPRRFQGRFVLTRIHARYAKDGMKDDLIFKAAPAMMGGREVRSGPNRTLEEGAKNSGVNNFQGRYAIRHQWTGPMECEKPMRGRWGGPPSGQRHPGTSAATGTAFAPRGKIALPEMVATDIPELQVVAAAALPSSSGGKPAQDGTGKDGSGAASADTGTKKDKKSGCGCEISASSGGAAGSGLLLLFAALMIRRRRR